MGWEAAPLILVILGSGLVALLVGLTTVRKRPDPMVWPLSLMMFAVAMWAIPHAISLGYSDIDRLIFWRRLQYLGTVFAPTLYLVVAVKYAGYERRLTRRVYAILSIIPILSLLVIWTNQYHGMFWKSFSMSTIAGISVLDPDYGIWYWVYLGYQYLVTSTGMVTLAGVFVRSGAVYRKQSGLMFVGGALPLGLNIYATFGSGTEPTIDFTTTALAVTGITFALALFYLDLLEFRPIARDWVMEELEDGVVVVGPKGRIRDYNPTANHILGNLSLEQPVEEVVAIDVATDGGELVVEMNGRERIFRTRSSRLTDDRGEEIGYILYLNEVTDLAEREQRISVLNRILRHNIRNKLNVASGQLEQVLSDSSTKDTEKIERSIKEITSVFETADKARFVENSIQRSEQTELVSAVNIASQAVQTAQENHPDASIEFTSTVNTDREGQVSVVDSELFEMALLELIENGIIHNNDESPRVRVNIESLDERVQIDVSDNGSGVPDEEIQILGERNETPLKHGSGLGLWLVKWMVDLSSGELSFTKNEEYGTTASLILQTVTDEK